MGALLADNHWILLTHLVSASTFVWLVLAVFLRARRTPLVYSYIAFQSAFLLWLLGKLAGSVTLDPRLKWSLVVLQYVGFCLLTPAFLIFAFTYARGRLPSLRFILPLASPSLLFLVAVATNPLHGLFFSSWSIFGFVPGALFYPHRLYEYGLGIFGAVLWTRSFISRGRGGPLALLLFLAAILVPLLSNVAFLARGDLFPFDITPLGFTVSIAFFSYAIFRHQMLDIVPVARRVALRHSPEGLMLFDARGRPLAWNEAMEAAFRTGRLRSFSLKSPVERFFNRTSSAASRVSAVGRLPRLDASLRREKLRIERVVTTARDCHWRVDFAPVTLLGRRQGTILRAIDISTQVRLRRDLAMRMHDLDLAGRELRRQSDIARETAEVAARNALARDVHDILGHSIVLVIALLEVARLSPGTRESAPALASVSRILCECLADIRAVPEDRWGRAAGELPEYLHAAAEEVRRAGVEVELIVQGRETRLDSARIEALTRVCREAITNALRHGAATRIGIALRYHVSGCELYVENNGRGARTITKGFGLTGIEARLAELGGEARFLSDGEAGFLVRAFVPYLGEATEGRF